MRRRAASNLGGGNVLLSTIAHQANVPQHDIDAQIVHLAYARLDRMFKAKAIAGESRSKGGRIVNTLRIVARDCGRDLARDPWRTLPPRTRALLLQQLSETDQKRLSAPGAAAVPECLKRENLPLKPPGRA